MSGMRKIPAREKREKEEKQTALIYAALKSEHTSRSSICNITGVKLHELNTLFLNNKDLYAEYTIRRKTLVDIAADNVSDIIKDKFHPHHFAASKYILNKYKSDLDTILTPVDESMILEIEGGSKSSPVKIVFSKAKPELIELGSAEDTEDDL